MRAKIYGAAAKWALRSVIQQQSNFNHRILDRIGELEQGFNMTIESSLSKLDWEARILNLEWQTIESDRMILQTRRDLAQIEIAIQALQGQIEATAEVADSTATLRWHFVGALQTNKCASVASYAHLVHSVDRQRLVDALGEAGVRRAEPVACLVQVDLDDVVRPGRSGARPADIASLAASIDAHPGLTLAGVMAVAPLGAPPDRAFAMLKTAADDVRQRYPHATVISAGMSNDLEIAVLNGATHLRVGTALLGSRRHPVG